MLSNLLIHNPKKETMTKIMSTSSLAKACKDDNVYDNENDKNGKDNVDLVVLPKLVQSNEGACPSNPSTAVDLRSMKLRRSLLKFY